MTEPGPMVASGSTSAELSIRVFGAVVIRTSDDTGGQPFGGGP